MPTALPTRETRAGAVRRTACSDEDSETAAAPFHRDRFAVGGRARRRTAASARTPCSTRRDSSNRSSETRWRARGGKTPATAAETPATMTGMRRTMQWSTGTAPWITRRRREDRRRHRRTDVRVVPHIRRVEGAERQVAEEEHEAHAVAAGPIHQWSTRLGTREAFAPPGNLDSLHIHMGARAAGLIQP